MAYGHTHSVLAFLFDLGFLLPPTGVGCLKEDSSGHRRLGVGWPLVLRPKECNAEGCLCQRRFFSPSWGTSGRGVMGGELPEHAHGSFLARSFAQKVSSFQKLLFTKLTFQLTCRRHLFAIFAFRPNL